MNKLNVRWRQYVWGPDTSPTLRGWFPYPGFISTQGMASRSAPPLGPSAGEAGLQLNLAKCKMSYVHRANSIPLLTYILKKNR